MSYFANRYLHIIPGDRNKYIENFELKEILSSDPGVIVQALLIRSSLIGTPSGLKYFESCRFLCQPLKLSED